MSEQTDKAIALEQSRETARNIHRQVLELQNSEEWHEINDTAFSIVQNITQRAEQYAACAQYWHGLGGAIAHSKELLQDEMTPEQIQIVQRGLKILERRREDWNRYGFGTVKDERP